MTKKTGELALRVIGLGASLLVLWRLGDWTEVGLIVKDISPLLFIIVLVLAVIGTWISSVRWRLLDPDLAAQMRQWDYFRYMMIGAVANLFMPGALGGDAVRTALVAKDLQSHQGVAVAAIVVDRWIGLFSILLLGTVACLAATGLEHRAELLSVLVTMDVTFVVGWLIVGNKSVYNSFLKLVDRPGLLWQLLSSILRAWREAILFYAANPIRVVGALALCLPIHVSWFLVAYIIASDIGIELSFLTLSMVTALSWIITAVPISFGGLGVRELSFVYLLSLQGIDAERATVLGACLSTVFMARALLGVPLIWLGRRKLVPSPEGAG